MMLNEPAPMFPTRSRLAAIRDLAVIALCLALMLGFLAQVLSAPPPHTPRAVPSALDVRA
jgi:hypothetical protein